MTGNKENKDTDELNERIIQKNGKYCLVSKKTDKNFGCYDDKNGAEHREKQVQFFKHMKSENKNLLEQLIKEIYDELETEDMKNQDLKEASSMGAGMVSRRIRK